jgi:hypothetical protein
MKDHIFEATDKFGEKLSIRFKYMGPTKGLFSKKLSCNEIESVYELSPCSDWIGEKTWQYQNKGDAKTEENIYLFCVHLVGNLDIVSIDFSKCKKSTWALRKYAFIHQFDLRHLGLDRRGLGSGTRIFSEEQRS